MSRVKLFSVTLASFGSLLALRACEANQRIEPPTTAPDAPSDPGIAQFLVELNAFRSQSGLAPLSWDNRLAAAAAAQTADLAAVDEISHTGSDGSTPKSRIRNAGYPMSWWAESAGAGYATASKALWAWMYADKHKANLLNPHATHVGLAVSHAADGTSYWILDLASGA